MTIQFDGSSPKETAEQSTILTPEAFFYILTNSDFNKDVREQIIETFIEYDRISAARYLNSILEMCSVDSLKEQYGIGINDVIKLFFSNSNHEVGDCTLVDHEGRSLISSREQYLIVSTFLLSSEPSIRIYESGEIVFKFKIIVDSEPRDLWLVVNSEQGLGVAAGNVISLTLRPVAQDTFYRILYEEDQHIALGPEMSEFLVKLRREKMMAKRGSTVMEDGKILEEVLINYIDDRSQVLNSLRDAKNTLEESDFNTAIATALQSLADNPLRVSKLRELLDMAADMR